MSSKYQFKRSPLLFSSIKSVLVTECSQSRVVLLHILDFFLQIFDQYVESICVTIRLYDCLLYLGTTSSYYAYMWLSGTLPGQIFIPIFINHHVLSFGSLVGFCGVVLSRFFEWDPVWRPEQQPKLLEVGQDLTSEMFDGSAFEYEDIIAPTVWLDNSCMGARVPGGLHLEYFSCMVHW